MILKYYKKDVIPWTDVKELKRQKYIEFILDKVTGKRNRIEDKQY
jgi:hypothetical protein